MKAFSDYTNAFIYAEDLATKLQRDCGIEKAHEFGSVVYRVAALPDLVIRERLELRCEVVRPRVAVETWEEPDGTWSYRFFLRGEIVEDHDFSSMYRALEEARSIIRTSK